ncbi:protein TBATA [Pangasianodon hypophthalmus]|uniref:protein TBATA n=1 Tax=Pangasianodon hypophthalmus TaxID=310915 RepID=UPI0023070921|nr:protein TBATA [Pangasianodon hypophthalmus]
MSRSNKPAAERARDEVMEMSERREQGDQEALKSKTPAPFMSGLKKFSPRVSTSSSARFGTLSHHSFFSRHNPHPHRVKHISGLNGSPVCIVNDDWYSNTPLFPHPLIRSQASSGAKHTSTSLPYHVTHPGADGAKQGAALISEAWREELKDLATKVRLSAAAPSQRAEHEIVREEEPMRRKTQYSSETGRIIPPTSWRTKRRDFHTPNTRPGPHRPQASQIQPGTISLEGQELRVLELLCQILQTDSLSLVQQWLLLAGDREKELVLGMLQQAMCDSSALLQQPQFPMTAQTEPSLQTRRKRRMRSVCSAGEMEKEKAVTDKPERIGDAEVLRVRPDESENINDSARQREHSC